MKYRCSFASRVNRIGYDAWISPEHACGTPWRDDLALWERA